MKGPRGIAKEVTVEKSRTIVYHFTADDLRKRLKLPDNTVLTSTHGSDGVWEIFQLDAKVEE